MLTHPHRFHGHGSLKYVYRNGDTLRCHAVIVRYTKNPRRSHSRFSVVVSKKVLKSAVGRNRIRRRVYEILRHEIERLTDTHDVALIICSSEVATMPHDELHQLLVSQLQEAQILTPIAEPA